MKTSFDENSILAHRIRKFAFLLNKIDNQILEDRLDLTLSQFFMLMAIRKHDCLTASQIAQYYDLTQAAVSRQIELLRQKKFIVILKAPQDMRQRSLQLTVAGTRLLTSAENILKQKHRELFGLIPNADKQKLITQFETLLGFIHHTGIEKLCQGPETKSLK